MGKKNDTGKFDFQPEVKKPEAKPEVKKSKAKLLQEKVVKESQAIEAGIMIKVENRKKIEGELLEGVKKGTELKAVADLATAYRKDAEKELEKAKQVTKDRIEQKCPFPTKKEQPCPYEKIPEECSWPEYKNCPNR